MEQSSFQTMIYMYWFSLYFCWNIWISWNILWERIFIYSIIDGKFKICLSICNYLAFEFILYHRGSSIYLSFWLEDNVRIRRFCVIKIGSWHVIFQKWLVDKKWQNFTRHLCLITENIKYKIFIWKK